MGAAFPGGRRVGGGGAGRRGGRERRFDGREDRDARRAGGAELCFRAHGEFGGGGGLGVGDAVAVVVAYGGFFLGAAENAAEPAGLGAEDGGQQGKTAAAFAFNAESAGPAEVDVTAGNCGGDGGVFGERRGQEGDFFEFANGTALDAQTEGGALLGFLVAKNRGAEAPGSVP